MLLPIWAYSQLTNTTSITSSLLEIETSDNYATFSGNVIMDNKDMRLKANKLRAYYNQDGKKDKLSVKLIEADGNVVITRKDQIITGDKAKYVLNTQIAELYGNVTLNKNGNILQGNHLVYNVREGKAEMLNAKADGRVKAVIHNTNKQKK